MGWHHEHCFIYLFFGLWIFNWICRYEIAYFLTLWTELWKDFFKFDFCGSHNQLTFFIHICPYFCPSIQVLDANRCFEKQCHSALSLQLAAYYYSLQIYSLLIPCFKNQNHTLYQVSIKHQFCVSGWMNGGYWVVCRSGRCLRVSMLRHPSCNCHYEIDMSDAW